MGVLQEHAPASTSSLTVDFMLFSSGIVFVGAMWLGGVPGDTIPTNGQADTIPRPAIVADSLPTPTSDSAWQMSSKPAIPMLRAVADTIPRRRASVAYSDGYGTRATIHRRLSYAMLPLFAISYFTGDKLFDEGPTAPGWVRNTHRASATSVAVLFTANTVTGGWNMWEARHDPINRKRRLVHSTLFLAATAGFAYSGAVLAEKAEQSADKRRDHRNLNLISMGLSASSVLVMLAGRN